MEHVARSAAAVAGNIWRVPAPHTLRCRLPCLCPQQPASRMFSAAGNRADDEWQISPKFGKSTVTQELWRRREADSMAVSAALQAVAYRFSTLHQLRDEYVGNTGKVLIGRMLEDLDALAGNVAFDWCSDTKSSNGKPLMLVTAAVDRIHLKRPVMITEDVILEGQVVYTGSSSLFVRIHMRAGRKSRSGEQLLQADFIYVALDNATKRSAKVPQFTPSTDEEKFVYEEAQAVMRKKKQLRKEKIQRGETPEEVAELTTMALAGATMYDLSALPFLREGQVLMQRTSLTNTELTKPQDQNTAGNVFGGLLMRSSYELAFATCFAFAGRHPVFKEVSEFLFERPVNVGALLRLQSRVVYTIDTRCLVEVMVKVIRPDHADMFRADKITVVFETGGPLLDVIPQTMEEARAKVKARNYMMGLEADCT